MLAGTRSFQQQGYGSPAIPVLMPLLRHMRAKDNPPQKAAVRETEVNPTPPQMAPEPGLGNGGDAPSVPPVCR